MASEPEKRKEQDRPQQARQQLERDERARSRSKVGQEGKQPVPGTYDDELESEEGAPEAEPSRPK
jgi:hypothetical protein